MKSSKEKLPKEFVVLVDTREQMPYRFPNSVNQALSCGDYSVGYYIQNRLITYEKVFAVERKGSVAELYLACGQNREQFEAELEKLAKLQFKAVLCEFNFIDILKEVPQGKIEPQCVYGSVLSWWVKFGVPFFWAGNRENARKVVYRLMEFFIKYNVLGF